MRSPSSALLSLCCVVSVVALIVALRGPQPQPEDSSLEARVSGLEEALQDLHQARTETINLARATGTRPTAEPPAAGEQSLDTRLQALEEWVVSREDDPAYSMGSNVTLREMDRTRQALDMIEREEMKARVDRWIGKEKKKVDAMVVMMGKQLQLTAHEHETLAVILAEENDGQGELMQELWGPDSSDTPVNDAHLSEQWDQAVARMKELRADRDAKLSDLLGAERYEKSLRMAKDALRAGRSRPPR